ncbi:MAG: DUF4468 domain-containing protein [Bacteroidaceae bacterium]
MTRKIIILLLVCIPFVGFAQSKNVNKKYMQGAVTVKNGMVEFEKTYEDKRKSKNEIYNLLLVYAQKLVKSENQLQQSRITEENASEGLISLSMEENLYFKKGKWTTDATRFFYQLIIRVNEGSFTVTMRRIRYIYDEERKPGGIMYNAESWITDQASINKKGTGLLKLCGKFRCKTIDRKNELFRNAAISVRGERKVVRQILVKEEDED